jgi:hypothetical protein
MKLSARRDDDARASVGNRGDVLVELTGVLHVTVLPSTGTGEDSQPAALCDDNVPTCSKQREIAAIERRQPADVHRLRRRWRWVTLTMVRGRHKTSSRWFRVE